MGRRGWRRRPPADNSRDRPNHDQTCDLDHDRLWATRAIPVRSIHPFNDAVIRTARAGDIDRTNCPGAANPTQARSRTATGSGMRGRRVSSRRPANDAALATALCGNTGQRCPGVGNRCSTRQRRRMDAGISATTARPCGRNRLTGRLWTATGPAHACDCQPIDPNDRRPGEVQTLSVAKTSTTANSPGRPSRQRIRIRSCAAIWLQGASQYRTCQTTG